MIDNQDTDVSMIATRAIASRGQSTLCVETGITNQQTFNSGSVSAATGGGGNNPSGTGVLNSLTGGTSGGGASCPELSQFVLIKSTLNTPIPTMVRYVAKGMYLWSPVSREFEEIVFAEDVESELWHVASKSIHATGSPSHPLIHENDDKGLALANCKPGAVVPVMQYFERGLTEVKTVYADGRGIVRKFETAGPTHIYCAGTFPELMFFWHNNKPLPDE